MSIKKESAAAPMWPETVYLDGTHKEVIFPEDEQAAQIGCPSEWRALFVKMKHQGKFPYMYDKLVVQKDPSAVGMAFRNLMKYVLDGEVFDDFGDTSHQESDEDKEENEEENKEENEEDNTNVVDLTQLGE